MTESVTNAFEDAEIAREELREREAFRDAFAEVLNDVAYTCGRIWEAWQYNTMTADDFAPAWEDEDLLGSLVDAALAKSTRQSPASTTAADAWDEGHSHCFHVENPHNPIKGNPYRVAAPEGDGGNE